MSKSKDDAPHELESQFVLRLPPVRGRSAGTAVAAASAVCTELSPSCVGSAGRGRGVNEAGGVSGKAAHPARGTEAGWMLLALGSPFPLTWNSFSTASSREALLQHSRRLRDN